MSNTIVRLPERGDIVLGELASKKVVFVRLSTFVLADVDTSLYEVIGVVYHREGNDVRIAYKNNATKAFCNRPWWYISGYTLDGTDRTITLTQNNLTLSVTYNATAVSDFVSQLNAAMQADSNFSALDWSANEVDGDGSKVFVSCNATAGAHYTCTASGVTITISMPEVAYKADIRRIHGGTGGEGSIAYWYRALTYYRKDNGSDSYKGGRTVEQTSIKQNYPINLPTWLGESTQNPGDFCANLRAVYGEGEDGWLAFMRSCFPVVPCDYGNMGQQDGLARTKTMADMSYTSAAKETATKNCPAADYCASVSVECITDWHLPTTSEVSMLVRYIQYGTDSSRTADAVNEGLYKIGGTAISNGSSLWSCLRYGSTVAWFAYGSFGYFYSISMYYTFLCVPVCSIKVE